MRDYRSVLLTYDMLLMHVFRYSYRFIADVPGTHWFHGHLGTDRSEGLLAALIVLPRNATQTGVPGQNPLGREYVALLQVRI